MDPLDVVRAAYAAWNAGDIGPVLRYAHAEVKWALVDARRRDDTIIARVHFDAAGATSGARVELDFLNEWRFSHGLVVEFRASPLQ